MSAAAREAMSQQARASGLCGEISADGKWICAKTPGHSNGHGDERWGDDYIDRVIETVRNHRDSDNSWPQWANILADEVIRLREAL